MHDDDVAEEGEELKRVRVVRTPTAAQRRQHEDENHSIYREWCEVCIQARGLGQQHRTAKWKQEIGIDDMPKISSDYCFMSSDESTVPILVMKNSRSKRMMATSLSAKGITDHGVKSYARFILQSGLQRCTSQSDNEPSILALKSAAAASCPGVEMVPRSCPVGDHQANGDVEVSVREIKRQMRAVRYELERKLGKQLDERDVILYWIPQFAADVI